MRLNALTALSRGKQPGMSIHLVKSPHPAPARAITEMKTMKLILQFSAIAVVAVGSLTGASAEEGIRKSALLEKIKSEKTLVVGVKTDFAPFGFLNRDGQVQGYEVDLARRIAQELGVSLKTVGVSTANRFQRLEQSAVHMIIATAGDTRERRKLATAIEPGYFGAGVNVLLRPEVAVKSWQDLRGARICGLQAAYFNKGINTRYGLDLKTYKTVGNAQAALKQGECIGFLYSETAIQNYLKKPDFAGYKVSLDPALIVPWAAFLPRSEKGTDFEILVGDIVAALHRQGYLIELQKKWDVGRSLYLDAGRERWSAKDESGQYKCRRNNRGDWPVGCRESAFVTSADVEGVSAVFKNIEERTGLNFSFVYDKYDRERYIWGLFYSLSLVVVATIISFISGFALAKYVSAGCRLGSGFVRALVFVLGCTPPLLSMYLVFFGLGAIIATGYGVHLSAFWVAVGSLGLYHGAIIAKTLIDSVNVRRSSDPHYGVTLAAIPGLLETSQVGINGAVTNLVKASMIASAIAVPELLSATIGIFSDQGNTHVMMILLFIVFLLFTTIWIWVVKRIQYFVISMGGVA